MDTKAAPITSIVTKRELVFQNKEKEKRAEELSAFGEMNAPEWVQKKKKEVDSIHAAKHLLGFNTSLIMAFCSTFYPQSLTAQTIYVISDTVIVAVKMSGTSTLHDWTMSSQTLSGEAQFALARRNIKEVSSLTFSLPVTSLKSNEKMLDQNAHEALKSDTYKSIFFKLSSARIEHGQESQNLIKAIGNLTVAGVTKEIALDVQCQVHQDKTITCSASKKLKMTEYDVKPPTFMMGLMKTGDEITLEFNLVFKVKTTLNQ